jgi:hypothetical protein
MTFAPFHKRRTRGHRECGVHGCEARARFTLLYLLDDDVRYAHRCRAHEQEHDTHGTVRDERQASE